MAAASSLSINPNAIKSNIEPLQVQPRRDKRKSKVTPPQETISIKHYDSLICELRCPGCAEIMKPPILICCSGHSVCESCTKNMVTCPLCKNDFTTIRSLTLEALAARFHFSCPNAKNGCAVRVPQALMGWHEAKCTFKSVKCFLGVVWGNCTWTGLQAEWIDHIQGTHTDKIWRTPDVVLSWKFEETTNPVATYYIFWIYEEIFNLYQIYDRVNSKMLWTLTCASTDQFTKFDYFYEIRLSHMGKVISFQYPCHNEDDDDIIQDGTCVVISIADIVRFLDENKTLTYSVKVLRHPKSPISSKVPEPLPRKEKPNHVKEPLPIALINVEGGNFKDIPPERIITKPERKQPKPPEKEATNEIQPAIVVHDENEESDPELEAFVSEMIYKASTPKLNDQRKLTTQVGSNFSLNSVKSVSTPKRKTSGNTSRIRKFFSVKNMHMPSAPLSKVSQSFQNLKLKKSSESKKHTKTENTSMSLNCLNGSGPGETNHKPKEVVKENQNSESI